MNILLAICLGVLSVWDYPARQSRHEVLRSEFMAAQKAGDFKSRVAICERGVKLLPEDPVWAYNLACSYALADKKSSSLEMLEKAIDFGFRDADVIASDSDFIKIANDSRFKELVEDARKAVNRPILFGPLSSVSATGIAGIKLAIGAQNLLWDLDAGCFEVKMKLATTGKLFDGFLYMNRDGHHSVLAVTNYLGLTEVTLDRDGRERGFDLDMPNMKFPYPVFGNCSRALVNGPFWRSLPRALTTSGLRQIQKQYTFYRSNQVWVFPAVKDYDFVSTNAYGDVFTSVMPYWIVTQGKSWSDQYYLRAALDATGAMKKGTRDAIVNGGLLAPTIQMLLRKSLKSVASEDDYLTKKAHPTAMPPNGLNIAMLKKLASSLEADAIPPLATIASVRAEAIRDESKIPELFYLSPCAWSFILQSGEATRTFVIQANGGSEYAFANVHDENGAATVTKLADDVAKVEINRDKMTWTNRIDVAIFAKNPGTTWGAPSFVSFAIVDTNAPYADPMLLPRKIHINEK